MILNCILLFQEECNSYACRYDALECSLNISLYENCSAIRQGIFCFNLFRNGICDNACRSEECLFDGFDCQPKLKKCNPDFDGYCLNHYGDGKCDAGCNTEECGWDGLDCINLAKDNLVPGSLVIIIGIPPDEFEEVKVGFLRDLSHLFRTNVIIRRDSDGNEMIFPYPEDSGRTKRAGSHVIKHGYVLVVSHPQLDCFVISVSSLFITIGARFTCSWTTACVRVTASMIRAQLLNTLPRASKTDGHQKMSLL